jgi:hypothetical protein
MDHVRFHPTCLEPPRQPEAVAAGFKGKRNPRDRAPSPKGGLIAYRGAEQLYAGAVEGVGDLVSEAQQEQNAVSRRPSLGP